MSIFVRALPLFVAVSVSSVLAQSDPLPAYAYDRVAEITMATTAARNCNGARVNDRKLQNTMVELMGKLAADGLDPVASVRHFETEAGQVHIAEREIALRARHGVAATGAKALCDAIKAEVKSNKSLANILKLR